jgi:hypothetical protein
MTVKSELNLLQSAQNTKSKMSTFPSEANPQKHFRSNPPGGHHGFGAAQVFKRNRTSHFSINLLEAAKKCVWKSKVINGSGRDLK